MLTILVLLLAEGGKAVNASRSVSQGSDARFREIPRERVSDRVASELLKLIADGRITPGERLPGERQLAVMMGVSRVSIRAALQQLKEQGLVSAVQGGGTRLLAAALQVDPGVTQLIRIDGGSLNDLIGIRATLEAWAARRAAERATPQQIAELEQTLHEAGLPTVSPHRKAVEDVRFQLAIARATNSPVFEHIFAKLQETIEATLDYQRSELIRSPETEQAVSRQHAAIVKAIRDHDPDAAATAVNAHLDFVREQCRRARSDAASATSQAAE